MIKELTFNPQHGSASLAGGIVSRIIRGTEKSAHGVERSHRQHEHAQRQLRMV